MDPISLSVGMSQINTSNDIGVAVLAKSLDMVKESGDSMINMMERSFLENSVNPNLGGNIDVMV